jgi:predicted nucleic acid-binding protein
LRRRSKAALSEDERFMLAALTDAIQDGRVAIIGPIRQEILSGIKDPSQFDKLKSALDAFADEQLTTTHYEEAARLFNVCRGQGVECGATDVLICAVAMRMHWSVLTSDSGLQRCMEFLRSEGIAK